MGPGWVFWRDVAADRGASKRHSEDRRRFELLEITGDAFRQFRGQATRPPSTKLALRGRERRAELDERRASRAAAAHSLEPPHTLIGRIRRYLGGSDDSWAYGLSFETLSLKP